MLSTYAQQKKDSAQIKTTKLQEVIVKGSLQTDPTHTSVKNKYQELIVQPKNVADLFTEINGFSLIKRGNYAVEPTFRAAMYEQLNVMYDGVTKAVHACPNRMDPLTSHVIPETISKIEVIKGPYTVRYGATFAGIVNMVSKNHTALQQGFSGNASSGYESNGNSYVGNIHLQQVTNQYDILVNAGYRNFGDYKDGNSIAIPSSFKSTDYGVRFGYNFNNNERIQLHWRQSFGRDTDHAGLPMDTEYDDSSIVSLDYSFQKETGALRNITAKTFYSYVDHLMSNANRPNFMMVEATSPVEATTFGGKIELEWFLNKNLNLFTGTDLNSINREGNRTRLVKMMNGTMLPTPRTFIDKIWQDAYVNDLGVFAETNYTFSPKTVFTAGVRIDFVSANAKDPETDFASRYTLKQETETNFSGTVSVKHKFSTKAILEAAFGRGVRTANMTERYINHFTVGQDSYEYLGNPNLKPEENHQVELGLKGNLQLSKTVDLNYETSVYYAQYNNYISAVVDPTIPRKFMPTVEPQFTKVFVNLDKATKAGFEFMAKASFYKKYFAKAELAYVKTKNHDFREALPLTAPFSSRFTVGYKADKFWANASFYMVAEQDRIARSFGETITEGYETVDLKLGTKVIKNTTLGVAVLNVFDKTYQNHLNFSYRNNASLGMNPITEPGRNITAFLQYNF